jgi:septum formation protein
MTPLVLASASPRRRALLAALGVPFEVMVTDAEEVFDGLPPAALVERNACAKRDAAAARLDRPAVVIGSDTLVFLEDHVLGKPRDEEEARDMLHRLSGRSHEVRTGLAVVDNATGEKLQGSECTTVIFRELSDDEINRFIDVVQPLDRAGAYTVDGPGSLLVAGYQGCYQNVLGFPLVRLDNLLRELGVHLFNRIDSENAVFL